MRKAGYNGVITESLRRRLHVTRYQSTLYTMHYSDYATHVKMTRGNTPIINGARLNFWFIQSSFIVKAAKVHLDLFKGCWVRICFEFHPCSFICYHFFSQNSLKKKKRKANRLANNYDIVERLSCILYYLSVRSKDCGFSLIWYAFLYMCSWANFTSHFPWKGWIIKSKNLADSWGSGWSR